MIFDKYILSRSLKLVYINPAGTLDSQSRTQNEQNYTQNNFIEGETITLSTQFFRVPSHANPVSNIFLVVFDLFPSYSQY